MQSDICAEELAIDDEQAELESRKIDKGIFYVFT